MKSNRHARTRNAVEVVEAGEGAEGAEGRDEFDSHNRCGETLQERMTSDQFRANRPPLPDAGEASVSDADVSHARRNEGHAASGMIVTKML